MCICNTLDNKLFQTKIKLTLNYNSQGLSILHELHEARFTIRLLSHLSLRVSLKPNC